MMAQDSGIAQALTAVFLPTVAALWLVICPGGALAAGLAEFAVKAEKAAVTVWPPPDSADQTAAPAKESAMPSAAPAAGSLPGATDSAFQGNVASPPAEEKASADPVQSPDRPFSDDNAPVVSPPGKMSEGEKTEKKPLP